ncbi:NYN domain-containing protein [Arcanobacterium ihumii]|uniref:NYN domain-containing protein n=1 Tax=Arcanobacterium ihumii TaxID=2138162 RepID=UPI00190F9AFD|nr:NYN domain-containing protein [Arcanobacterium ihumii]
MKKRKVALRRGEELESQSGYILRPASLKAILSGKKELSDLKEHDFFLDIIQKGVDMRLGLDIASLAERGHVNQIIMISGDSDFVPAAKLARRAGIDFILDPMWSNIANSLSEHVDGVRQCVNREPENKNDPLHIDNSSEPISIDEDLDLDDEL